METHPPHHPHAGGSDHTVKIAISTTAGFFPAEGFDDVSGDQKVHVQLEKAAKALKLTDTSRWIATVTDARGKRTIDVAKTYAENALIGEVTIDWGPSEGGGGAPRRG
jgi:hypothetical protein